MDFNTQQQEFVGSFFGAPSLSKATQDFNDLYILDVEIVDLETSIGLNFIKYVPVTQILDFSWNTTEIELSSTLQADKIAFFGEHFTFRVEDKDGNEIPSLKADLIRLD